MNLRDGSVQSGFSQTSNFEVRSRVSNFSKMFSDRRLTGSRSVKLDRARNELRKLFHRAKTQPTV